MPPLEYVLLLVLLPLVGAVLSLVFAPYGIEHVRRVVLTNVLLSLALAVMMVLHYDPTAAQLLQMRSNFTWLSPAAAGGPNIQFSLGVDGISLWLIALTAVLMLPAVLVSWDAVRDRPATFYALMLLLQSGLVGVFAAQDIILFYIFFEFTLIPLFFMIGLWGGHDRRWAARKFFVYTFAGSALTFLGLLFIVLSHSWMQSGVTAAGMHGPAPLNFSIPELTAQLPQLITASEANAAYWARVSPWIFLALFAGFAIKVPLFPFHTWLPLAHVEAPTAGSVLLAGVLLKIGSYGFLRFALPLVPDACWQAFHWVAWLSVIGIIYGALLALAQDDIKKLVAYSSVSHMGFCLLGLFSLNTVGMTGGLLQMVNHGLSTGALFAIVGMLYERYHTRDIEAFGGLARKFPVLTFFLVVVTFSSIGLPGLNGFTGEILSLAGMFRANALYAILSLSGIILGAWYMLWLVQRTFFGKLREPLHEGHGHDHHAHPPIGDMNCREWCALLPLTVLIFAIGIFPQYFISRMEPSIVAVAKGLSVHRQPLQTAVVNQPPVLLIAGKPDVAEAGVVQPGVVQAGVGKLEVAPQISVSQTRDR